MRSSLKNITAEANVFKNQQKNVMIELMVEDLGADAQKAKKSTLRTTIFIERRH